PVEGVGFSAGASSTDKLAVLSWNWLVFYPKGYGSDEIGVQASLKLPGGWQWASALPHSSSAGAGSGNATLPAAGAKGNATLPAAGAVAFALASLTTLVDSPVLMGEYMKKVPLQVGQSPPHELDIAADSEAALEMQP